MKPADDAAYVAATRVRLQKLEQHCLKALDELRAEANQSLPDEKPEPQKPFTRAQLRLFGWPVWMHIEEDLDQLLAGFVNPEEAPLSRFIAYQWCLQLLRTVPQSLGTSVGQRQFSAKRAALLKQRNAALTDYAVGLRQKAERSVAVVRDPKARLRRLKKHRDDALDKLMAESIRLTIDPRFTGLKILQQDKCSRLLRAAWPSPR